MNNNWPWILKIDLKQNVGEVHWTQLTINIFTFEHNYFFLWNSNMEKQSRHQCEKERLTNVMPFFVAKNEMGHCQRHLLNEAVFGARE